MPGSVTINAIGTGVISGLVGGNWILFLDGGSYSPAYSGSGISALSMSGSWTFTDSTDTITPGLYAVQLLTSANVLKWDGWVYISSSSGTFRTTNDPQTARYLDAAVSTRAVPGDVQVNIAVPAAVAAASQAANTITMIRGDTLRRALPTLGSVSARTKAWLTVKRQLSDADAASLLQIIEGVGCTIFNGAPFASPSFASLAIDSGGIPTIYVDEALTALIDQWRTSRGYYDIQILMNGDITSPQDGVVAVSLDVTRATS